VALALLLGEGLAALEILRGVGMGIENRGGGLLFQAGLEKDTKVKKKKSAD
jgi:hypothetical protein